MKSGASIPLPSEVRICGLAGRLATWRRKRGRREGAGMREVGALGAAFSIKKKRRRRSALEGNRYASVKSGE